MSFFGPSNPYNNLFEQLNSIEQSFYEAVSTAFEKIKQTDLDDKAGLLEWLNEARNRFIFFKQTIGYDILANNLNDLSNPQKQFLAPRIQIFANDILQYCQSLVPDTDNENPNENGEFIQEFKEARDEYAEAIKNIFFKCIPTQVAYQLKQNAKAKEDSENLQNNPGNEVNQASVIPVSASNSSSSATNITFVNNNYYSSSSSDHSLLKAAIDVLAPRPYSGNWLSYNIGFNSGFSHHRHFGGFDSLIPGGYGAGYSQGVMMRFTFNGISTIAKMVFHGGKFLVKSAGGVAKESAHALGYVATHGVDFIGSAAHGISSIASGGFHAIGSLASSGIHGLGSLGSGGIHLLGSIASGGGHLLLEGVSGLGHIAGAGLNATGDCCRSCDKDCCKICGGGTGVVAVGGGAAISSAPTPPPTTPPPGGPTPPPQPNPPVDPSHGASTHLHHVQHASHPVSHTATHATHLAHPVSHTANHAAHAAKQGIIAKLSATGAASGSTTANTVGSTGSTLGALILAKFIFGLAYCLILLPRIMKTLIEDVRNLYHQVREDFSTRRITARVVLGSIMFVAGWFIPFGGPLSAVALATFGIWAGEKLTTWWEERKARKTARLLNPEFTNPTLLNQYNEEAKEKIFEEVNACSHPETYQMSSKEIEAYEKIRMENAKVLAEKNAPLSSQGLNSTLFNTAPSAPNNMQNTVQAGPSIVTMDSTATAPSTPAPSAAPVAPSNLLMPSTAQLIKLLTNVFVVMKAEEIASKKDQKWYYKASDKLWGIYRENEKLKTAESALSFFKKGKIAEGSLEMRKLNLKVDQQTLDIEIEKGFSPSISVCA